MSTGLGTGNAPLNMLAGSKTSPNRSPIGDESVTTFSNPSPIRKRTRCANDRSTDDPTAADALFERLATGIDCLVGQQVHTSVVFVRKTRFLIRCEFAESDGIELAEPQQPPSHVHTEAAVIIVNETWYGHTRNSESSI